MALKSFTCTVCDTEFKAGEWNCADGRRHKVPEKTYYSLVGGWRTYVSEDRVINLGDGRTRTQPARSVQFLKGTYTTSDPEDQYALDAHPGLCTEQAWQEKFIEKEELLAKKEREIANRERELNRKIQEQNDLLEKVKQEKGKPKDK